MLIAKPCPHFFEIQADESLSNTRNCGGAHIENFTYVTVK